MDINPIVVVRIVQLMNENGWLFVDNGYNRIEKAINNTDDVEFTFESDEEFLNWLLKKVCKYL